MVRITDDSAGSSGVFRIALIVIEVLLIAVVAILGLSFLMQLLGANPEAPFTSWIYARTETFMTPFNGVFDPIQITGESEIRTSLLFAMVVYGILAGLLGKISQRL